MGGGEIVESRGDAIHRVSIGTSRSNDFGVYQQLCHTVTYVDMRGAEEMMPTDLVDNFSTDRLMN